MKTPDYYEEENEFTRKSFNLEEIISFQKEHRVEVIMEADLQYACYIDGASYASSLTPINAMMVGIRQYKRHKIADYSNTVQNLLTPDQAFNPEENNSKDPITII